MTATKYVFDKGTGSVSPMANPDLFEGLVATAPDESEHASSSLQSVKGLAFGASKLATSAVAEGLKTAKSLVQGEEDGAYYSGGFLSFTSLRTTNAARQMVHHKSPFSMEVLQAPDPGDGTYYSL